MLELEIQSLLILHGSASGAAKALYEKYKTVPLKLEQAELISVFYLLADLPATLVDFIIEQIKVGGELPWAHFVQALQRSNTSIDEELWTALINGAADQKTLWQLAKHPTALSSHPELADAKELAKKYLQEKALRQKRELLAQIETLRSQEMDEAEGTLLQKVLKMFPRDMQIQEQFDEYRSRKALQLLERKNSNTESSFDSTEPQDFLDPESIEILQNIQSSMLRELHLTKPANEILQQDFAIAHLMWDNPDGALTLTTDAKNWATLWLHLEAELKAKRYLDLIQDLIEIEKNVANNPDATLSIHYLRAKALWGLGRRYEAIELLDGLAAINPQFLDVSSRLQLWKDRIR